MAIEAKEVRVTPKIAEQLLEKNTLNRPLHDYAVHKYVRMIKNGEWKPNGQTVSIAPDGTLLDGQHRLWAIIEADTPVKLLIANNVPKESFPTIDQGVGRTACDVFTIEKIPNPKTVSSALNRIYRYLFGESRTTYGGLSVEELVDLYMRHQDIQKSVEFGVLKTNGLNLLPVAYGVGFHYLMAQVNRAKADQFFTALKDGEFGIGMATIKNLRERLLVALSDRTTKKLSPQAKGALVIKSWEAWSHGKVIRVMRYNENDHYPKIKHLPRKFVKSFQIRNT